MGRDRLPKNKLLQLSTAPKGGINETQQQAWVTTIFLGKIRNKYRGLAQSDKHRATSEDTLTSRGLVRNGALRV